MDFAFTEDQAGIRTAIRQILTDLVTDDSLKALEREGRHFHEKVWRALAEAEMLGLALPEEVGGTGLGLIELCFLLQEVGRTVAPIPALTTLVSASLPIAQFGTDEQKQRLLAGVVRGETILTLGHSEYGSRDALEPATTATADGEGFRVTGTFTNVEYAAESARILVPARIGEDLVVLLVDPQAAGVTLAAQRGTNQLPLWEVSLGDVLVPAADVLAGPARGREVWKFAIDRTRLGMCAIEHGIAERAVEMTAGYASERKQFGVPIGVFQAVTQRIADAFIDAQAIEVSLWQAAWRLAEGLDADQELAIAKFFAADAGARVVAAAQHIHGGMGFDRDYPLHRYFLTSKHMEMTLGAAPAQLDSLGALLARG
ncbi:MAG: acyl-CoA/acyl-ACP dehydrogenase [Polyangiaceae bacterium]|nr:acyl-CoA/acyl-ACP dehydrogenase [Polyangiaceae bacterium]